jgi:hypothetical protein
MNERIVKLANQCQINEGLDFDHIKFAELIVRECANIAFDVGALAGRSNKMERLRGCTEAGKEIKHRFGVK